MHVLLIHQAFVTTGEAGGTRHIEISRFLVQAGHRVTIITSPVSYLTGETKHGDTPKREENIDGIRVLYAKTSRGMHKGFFPRLWAFFSFMFSSFWLGLRVPGVDIVWGTSPNLFQACSAWAVARVRRVKFLLEIRDLWPDFAIGMGVLKNPVFIYLARRLEKFLYRYANQIVVNSPGFIPHIQKISGKKAILVPNSADVDMFVGTDRGKSFRAANGIDDDRFVLMYTGAHGPANDLWTALDGAQLLMSLCPKVLLVFVGSGKEKAALMERAKEMALTNVLFLDPVSKAEIKNVIAGADAGLAILKAIPEFTTTYPNKVFDFMAAGKPVLCQIDGVIRSVVERYRAGVFAVPGDARSLADAAMRLANDPADCRMMGVNGRNAIRTDFSREKTAEKFLAALERLLYTGR